MKYRQKALLIGIIGGALVGAVLALTSSEGYDDANSAESPIASLGPADYFQLGIGVLTLARQFGQMLKRA